MSLMMACKGCPLLCIVVERELVIANFKAAPFWTIEASYGESFGAQVATFEAPSEEELDEAHDADRTPRLKPKRFFDKVAAAALVTEGRRARHVVEKLETKPVVRRPPPPFTTASLLGAATAVGMRPSTVSAAAQRLFEGGFIT